MTEIVAEFNFIIAVLTILILIDAGILVFDQYGARVLQKVIDLWGMLIAFVVTLSGTILSLIYSEVFGFVPCGLCWLQRVFLYPQAILTGMALWYKDKSAARYGIGLSIPGLIIALYQHYLQMGGSELINCPAAAGDCAKRYLFEFGFVTFPLVAAIVFIFLIALYVYILKTREGSA